MVTYFLYVVSVIRHVTESFTCDSLGRDMHDKATSGLRFVTIEVTYVKIPAPVMESYLVELHRCRRISVLRTAMLHFIPII